MKTAFVYLYSDHDILNSLILKNFRGDFTLFTTPDQIEELQSVQSVYFVVSDLAMHSTWFQATVVAALNATKRIPRRVIKLDNAEIKTGFHGLKSLPEISVKDIK